MRWQEFSLLDDAGFGAYEKKALVTLGVLGVADAATLCREGRIPTSKIYRTMEKLRNKGLCEIEHTRPKLYLSIGNDEIVDRLVELTREHAEAFAARAARLRETLAALPGRLQGRRTSVDLALGTESHVKRHLARLAAARRTILSYVEEGDLTAIERVAASGFDAARRINAAATARSVDHRVIFGFSARTAPRLLAFLRDRGPTLGHLRGVRYSGELGHPFHVVDGETVILSLDHPFVPEGRFASLLVRDRDLASHLTHGFDGLWARALQDLREVRMIPTQA